MDIHILAVQARLLLWIGLGWLALGLWLGQDPLTVAWRAALGGLLAVWLGGKLLRMIAGVIEERLATEMAERQLAEETALAKVAAAKPGAAAAGVMTTAIKKAQR